MVLFTESTTPFVNLRWHLDVAGLKSSKLYIWNGVALFFGLLGLFFSYSFFSTCITILMRQASFCVIHPLWKNVVYSLYFVHRANSTLHRRVMARCTMQKLAQMT
ncbi:hypothetical protein Ahy_A01g004198 isoform F [Arachis hypogaea]|uniref:TLC domain-containing protein n=1 Tax=Arachis hypogaea TaxID=3818 RepID=A0A445EVF0_ARAHY|nr:hypothetical protein Ahy_A01g004198 isoform F [Arachis hypogaea]